MQSTHQYLMRFKHSIPVFWSPFVKSARNILYTIQLRIRPDNISAWQRFDARIFLLLAGDIESTPYPNQEQGLKFCHWDLNSTCARESIKIPLIEAYNTIYHHDILALSDTMLNASIDSESISIEGFSKDIFRNDHPSNNKIGGACIYYREGLPIRRRKDLECLQEMIIAEITIAHKQNYACNYIPKSNTD